LILSFSSLKHSFLLNQHTRIESDIDTKAATIDKATSKSDISPA